MSSELKPCPFCGSSADLEITSLFEGDTSLVVSCTGCGCELLARHNATEQEAIAAWNQRAERTCTWSESRDIGIDYDPLDGWHCSGCNRLIDGEDIGWEIPNYCPNCGAKVME